MFMSAALLGFVMPFYPYTGLDGYYTMADTVYIQLSI